MKTFNQFILNEEIKKSTRQSMLHLEKAKPKEFLELAKSMMLHGGKLDNMKVSLKVDGAGIRFGKDVNGKFFFETSRSGPIQTHGAFSRHAASREGADTNRAKHYDDMYRHIESSNLWKDLPTDTKVVAEVMYNPMAEVKDNKIKFVSVNYDTKRLGSLMTIIPFDVIMASTGQGLKEVDKTLILSKLIKKSTAQIKVASANLRSSIMDVSLILKPLEALKDAETILTSRKGVDKEIRAAYEDVVQRVKDQLAAFILKTDSIQGKDVFGPEIEGLVLDMGSRVFKVTTQSFKDSKKKG